MKKLFLILIVTVVLSACTEKQSPHARYDIIPLPATLIEKEGEFTINKSTTIYIPENNEAIRAIAELFCRQLKMGQTPQPNKEEIKDNSILFELISLPELGGEGYKLLIDKHKIVAQANEPNGLFYAMQTLFQMLPPAIYSNEKFKNINWTIACAEITDYPRFSHRGMHLDVCRHFFPVNQVKQYIDLLAMQKMNRFHWHLTDDQGWRIEIKKYPKLNEIGSWRSGTMEGHYTEHRFDTIRYGGYYTQEEIKDVVAYAATKYIEVIPEIEMPGHAQAAVASYPWLCCRRDTVYDVCQEWGVFEPVFCTTDSVFMFLEDVISEIIPLFPSEYIHIGGDECPKTHWKKCPHCQAMLKKHKLKDEHELQSYFVQRIEKFVNSQGKKIIGWDEILEGGLAPNATVMSWRGEEGGIAAANQNHDVIMAPTSYCYLDYYQADPRTEPLAIGGYVPIEKVYSFNPVPKELPTDKHKYILGMQGNIWTEYIGTFDKLQYMVFPRSAAIAEIAWTPDEKKDFTNFRQRLLSQFERYNYMGVSYGKQVFDVTVTSIFDKEKHAHLITLESYYPELAIRYTTDGSEPTAQSDLYSTPVELPQSATFKTATFRNGKRVGNVIARDFFVYKSTGKPYTFANEPVRYLGTTTQALTDGIRGYAPMNNEWVGFKGTTLDVTLDLETEQPIKRIAADFLDAAVSWIFLPLEVEAAISIDGKTFAPVGKHAYTTSNEGGRKAVTFEVTLNDTPVRFVRLTTKNILTCPKGHPGEGYAAWLFIDEIVVE